MNALIMTAASGDDANHLRRTGWTKLAIQAYHAILRYTQNADAPAATTAIWFIIYADILRTGIAPLK